MEAIKELIETTPVSVTANIIDYDKSARYQDDIKKLIRTLVIPQRFLNIGKVKKLPKSIGFVGSWGSGKSLSEAAMSIIDFMLDGIEVYSNMDISFVVRLGNMVAVYKSQPLNKVDLLKLQLGKGLLVIDEPNIEFAEARRAMSNRNLQFDKVIQMLRKKEMSLLYAVISEMWVEQRLRECTTMFIKCQDILLQPGNMGLPFDFGERVNWKGYDMIGILGHGSYYDTKQNSFEKTFHARQFWNCYDTGLVQGEYQTKYGKDDIPAFDAAMKVTEQPHMEADRDQWGWLSILASAMQDDGRMYIPVSEIMQNRDIQSLNITQNKLSTELKKRFGITTRMVTENNERLLHYVVTPSVLVTTTFE